MLVTFAQMSILSFGSAFCVTLTTSVTFLQAVSSAGHVYVPAVIPSLLHQQIFLLLRHKLQ